MSLVVTPGNTNANFVRGARSKADHIYGTDHQHHGPTVVWGPDLFWDKRFHDGFGQPGFPNKRAPSEEGSRSERKMEIEEDESEVNSSECSHTDPKTSNWVLGRLCHREHRKPRPFLPFTT